MKTRKTLLRVVLVLILVGAALMLVFGKIYLIRDDGGAEVLWNSNEAYLFLGAGRRGYQTRLIEEPWDFVKEMLNGVVEADDRSTSVTVLHITSSGVERHMFKAWDEEPANVPDLTTPFDGRIYANCRGTLCKWNGDKFETATEEEQRRLDGTNKLTAREIDKDAAGWSKREFGSLNSTVDVGGKFKLQITSVPEDSISSTFSVELARPGQPVEHLWRLDRFRPGMVSWKKYKEAFGK